MDFQNGSLVTLNRIFSDLRPGNVFHLLNDSFPHVVVIKIGGDDEGVAVIDQEVKMIFGHRPVRFYGEHADKFNLDYGLFELVEMIDPLENAEVGDMLVLYDLEAVEEGYQDVEAEVVVLGYKNEDGKYFVTTNGQVIFFRDTNFLPTNFSLNQDEIEFTSEGEKRLEELHLPPDA